MTQFSNPVSFSALSFDLWVKVLQNGATPGNGATASEVFQSLGELMNSSLA